MLNTKLRPLAWAAYAVALLLMVIPLTEVLLGVWPLRVGQLNWRFGAAGLVSQAVVTPLLGMLLALATAALVGHRAMARTLSVLALAGGVLGVLALIMFGLDTLQARAGVPAERLGVFDTAAIVASLKYLLGTVTAVLLGIGGWKVSRKQGRDAAAGSRAGEAKTAEADSRVLIGANRPKDRD